MKTITGNSHWCLLANIKLISHLPLCLRLSPDLQQMEQIALLFPSHLFEVPVCFSQPPTCALCLVLQDVSAAGLAQLPSARSSAASCNRFSYYQAFTYKNQVDNFPSSFLQIIHCVKHSPYFLHYNLSFLSIQLLYQGVRHKR